MEARSGNRLAYFKTIMVWFALVLVGTFYLSLREISHPVSIKVMPEAPRQGEPMVVTFQLNNPKADTVATDYRFYTDGVLIKEGTARIAPFSSKTYQYVYASPVPIGRRVSFAVKTSSDQGSYEKLASIPAFPPQLASSFISFASFSTTVMSSMTTTTHYQSNFSTGEGLNVGLVLSITLILLLIFLELSGAAIADAGENSGFTEGIIILRRIRIKYTTLTGVLFIIFIGIVYTKIIMILAA